MSQPVSTNATKQTDVGETRERGPDRPRRVAGPYAGILGLQRAAGNRAVSELLAPSTLIQRRAAGPERSQDDHGAGPTPVQPGSASRVAPEQAGLTQVQEVLRSGNGEPLTPPVRAEMEERFGRSLGHVRVQTDRRAAESAQSLDALAYTVGRHIVFGAGQYAPDTPRGQYLLAHELAHVLQWSGSGQPTDLALDVPDSPLEGQADRAVAQVMAGNQPQSSAASLTSPGLVLRHASDKTICPGPPLYKIISARPRDVYGPANEAIERAYLDDARHKNQSILLGSQFEYGGNKEIRLPKGAPDRKAGDAILSRLRGLVRQRAPDIINLSERVFYEIKTPRYAASGMVQLESYYAITDVIRLELGEEGGPPWDQGAATWYPPHVLPFPGNPRRLVCTQMTDYSVTAPGLILYVVLELQEEEEEKEKKPQAKEMAKPEQKQEKGAQPQQKPQAEQAEGIEEEGGGSPLPMVAIGAGGAALTAGAIALLRKRAQEQAKRRAAQLAWRKMAEAAAARRAAQAAGKGALGKAAGKAAAYVEIAAAAALVIFYSDRVEAKVGLGPSPIETLYKAMTTSGTPPSPELKKLIESDPLLKQLAEEAASSGDATPLQQEMMRRTLELIRNNPDMFSPEDLEFLMQYSKTAQATGETPTTAQELRKAIDAARAGKTGKGKGKGKGKGEPEGESEQETGKEQKPGTDSPQGTGGESLAAEVNKQIENAPAPVRELFRALISTGPEGTRVDKAFVDEYLKLLASIDPPLTEADVARLRTRILPPKGAGSPAQTLDRLRKALAERKEKAAEGDKGGEGKPGKGQEPGEEAGGEGKEAGDKKRGKGKETGEGKTGKGGKAGTRKSGESGTKAKGKRRKAPQAGPGKAGKRKQGGRPLGRQKPRPFTGTLEGDIRTVQLTLNNIPHDPPSRMRLPVTYQGSDGKVYRALVWHKIEVLGEPRKEENQLIVAMRFTSQNSEPIGFPPFGQNADGKEVPEAVYAAETETEGEVGFKISK